MSVKLQHVFPVAIRCGQGTVCQGRLLNLSVHGMLAEFPSGQIPPVPVDAKVSVKLHYLGDSIWLPGLVRHRKGQKIGFFFPALTNHPTRMAKHPLTVVLHSLSRAVATPSHLVSPFSHSRGRERVSI
jgi:PilZ domain